MVSLPLPTLQRWGLRSRLFQMILQRWGSQVSRTHRLVRMVPRTSKTEAWSVPLCKSPGFELQSISAGHSRLPKSY